MSEQASRFVTRGATLIRLRLVAILALFVVFGSWSVACGDVYIGGACLATADCHTWYNYFGGAVCLLDRCTCPNPFDDACCPDGGMNCPWNENECRPRSICEAGLLADASGTSSMSSSGAPITPVPPGGACSVDEQCPEPEDYRCGARRCTNGVCAFEISLGSPITGQYPGDCATGICSLTGQVIQQDDLGDVPLDGNPCTHDFCVGKVTVNQALPDGVPCPGQPTWICVLGKCQECSLPLQAGTCKPGEFCEWDHCAPLSCGNNVYDNLETDLDCGGPDCVPCPPNYACNEGSDCNSGVCTANICQEGALDDGVKNNLETGVDCGSPEGPPNQCGDGEACRGATDCASEVCYVGVCQAPTCEDDRKNGGEVATDCGGGCTLCPP